VVGGDVGSFGFVGTRVFLRLVRATNHHTALQMIPSTPRMTKARRQPMVVHAHTTSGVAMIGPIVVPDCARLSMVEVCRIGNQFAVSLVLIGACGPSPAPNSSRATMSDAALHALAVSGMVNDHTSMQIVYTLRTPIRSTMNPPKSANGDYVQKNALRITPQSAGEKWNSARMNGAATDRAIRSP
jgi:hypothetical protein